MADFARESKGSRGQALALCALLVLTASAAGEEDAGKYIGVVKTEWLKDGRKMRLLEKFTYVDPKGVEWLALAGSEIDGASIPQAGWSLVGGPYEGKYREASVIHDVACNRKSSRWEDVHEAFYWAMLASGVERWRAKAMYAVVYHKGPRWPSKRRKISILDPEQLREETLAEEMRKGAQPGSRIELDGGPNYVITVIPPSSPLSDGDVEGLAQRIREREEGPEGGLTLEEIRKFKPGG